MQSSRTANMISGQIEILQARQAEISHMHATAVSKELNQNMRSANEKRWLNDNLDL